MRYSRRSYSTSDSLDRGIGRLEIDVDNSRPRRRRSPSVKVVDRVRYVNDSTPRRPVARETIYVRDPPRPRSPVTRETIYIEERVRGRPRLQYDDDRVYYYDDNHVDRSPRSALSIVNEALSLKH